MSDTDARRVLVVGGGELSVDHRRQIVEALAERGHGEVAVVFGDHFRDIPQALARIPEVTTRETEAAIKRIAQVMERAERQDANLRDLWLHRSPTVTIPDPFAPVNNRAARRARQFGRASR